MYKTLIVGAGSLLIGLGLFFFHQAGVPDLIAQDIENGGKSGRGGVSAFEVFSGVYECIAASGCKNPTRIILEQDTTADVVAVIDNQDVNLGQGTWGIGSNGALILMLKDTSEQTTKSIIAKKITTIRISNFSTKKPLYPGMENPTFTRIGERHEKDTVKDTSHLQENLPTQSDSSQ